MTSNTSAGLAHGELFTPDTFSGRPDPWRAWSVKVDGRYSENETLDCPTSRYFEVTNRGPRELLVASVPEGEIVRTVQPSETVVLREPSRLLCPLDFTNAEVREYFAVDVPDEQAAA